MAKIIPFLPKSEMDKVQSSVEYLLPLLEEIKAYEDACDHQWGDWDVHHSSGQGWNFHKEADVVKAHLAHQNLQEEMQTAMVRMCDVCGKLEERAPASYPEREAILEAFQDVLRQWNPVFRRFGLTPIGKSCLATPLDQ